MKDASQNVLVAARLMNPAQKENYIQELNNEYALLRQKNEEKQVKLVSLEEAQQNKLKLFD
jgi:5-methyltetrahydrofolate--homocysteine methyltransferase